MPFPSGLGNYFPIHFFCIFEIMQQNSLQQNLHLLLSSVIVVAAAMIYGISPSTILPQLFDFQVATTDLSNIFRAIMGLYLAFASFWMLGMLRSNLWKAATLSQVLFMGGLAFGRILSLFFDGVPSTLFALGTIGELILAVFGYYQIRIYGRKT
jgi:hypothetical protein